MQITLSQLRRLSTNRGKSSYLTYGDDAANVLYHVVNDRHIRRRAMIFTTNRAKTAPLILSELMGAVDGTEWGVLFAGVTLQLVPVVLLVTLARRYLIAGLAAGAVKG